MASSHRTSTSLRQRPGASQRYRTLVAEVADYLDAKHPASSAGWEIIALPEGVVRRVREAASSE